PAAAIKNHDSDEIRSAPTPAGHSVDCGAHAPALALTRTVAMRCAVLEAPSLPRRIGLIGRPERLDIRDQLPDLIARQLRAPRRHSVLATLGDRREDRRVVAAVAPKRVAQARAHAAA